MSIFIGGTGSANELDDYEEGTWTPTFTVAESDSGVTYASSHREGFYLKIGSLVYVKGMMSLSSLGSGSSGGTAGIGGFPFTIRNDLSLTSQEGFGMLTYWSNTNQSSNFIFWVKDSGTIVKIQKIHGANNVADATKGDFNNNSDLRFSCFYCAD